MSDSSDTFIDTSLNRYPLRAYFTYWYLPTEVAKRVGLDISAGSLSGALVTLTVGRRPDHSCSQTLILLVDQFRWLDLVRGV